MAKIDYEQKKLEDERKKKEKDRLPLEIIKMTDKVPKSVIEGSYQMAVDYKAAAKKGVSLINSARPSLDALQKCAGQLARFN